MVPDEVQAAAAGAASAQVPRVALTSTNLRRSSSLSLSRAQLEQICEVPSEKELSETESVQSAASGAHGAASMKHYASASTLEGSALTPALPLAPVAAAALGSGSGFGAVAAGRQSGSSGGSASTTVETTSPLTPTAPPVPVAVAVPVAVPQLAPSRSPQPTLLPAQPAPASPSTAHGASTFRASPPAAAELSLPMDVDQQQSPPASTSASSSAKPADTSSQPSDHNPTPFIRFVFVRALIFRLCL